MIRLVTLDEFEPELIQKLTRLIFQAYGLGCEYVGEAAIPAEAKRGGKLDAGVLLDRIEKVRSYADDKVVFLTSQPLAGREMPSGQAPTPGYSLQGGGQAVLSSHGLPQGENLLRPLAKQAIHDIGHLWDLHHCLDPRCAMHPPWALTFQSGEPILCTFCREKSEQRIRLAKT